MSRLCPCSAESTSMDINYLKEISKPKPCRFSLRGTLFGLVSEIVRSREALEITSQPNDNLLRKNDIEAPAVLVNYGTRPQKDNHMFVCFPLLALLLLLVITGIAGDGAAGIAIPSCHTLGGQSHRFEHDDPYRDVLCLNIWIIDLFLLDGVGLCPSFYTSDIFWIIRTGRLSENKL